MKKKNEILLLYTILFSIIIITNGAYARANPDVIPAAREAGKKIVREIIKKTPSNIGKIKRLKGSISRKVAEKRLRKFKVTTADKKHLRSGSFYKPKIPGVKADIIHIPKHGRVIKCTLENKNILRRYRTDKSKNGGNIIDRTFFDPNGRKNALVGIDGKPVELHHVGCKPNSPITLMSYTEHKKNNAVLHETCKGSNVHNLQNNDWNSQKRKIWGFVSNKLCR